MPMNRALYPANWEAIALEIKTAANWTCTQCGRPCRRPGESVAKFVDRLAGSIHVGYLDELYEEVCDEETGGYATAEKPQRFTLTVAHLDHIPENCDRSNLRALCAPCHCRYDLAAMATKRRLKLERQGQLTLFEVQA